VHQLTFSAKQALEAVAQARRLIIAAKIPFTRPVGYFCEMLKTEEHMTKIGAKVTEEKDAAKAAELARKQRLNRKYGKKIQVEREQEKQQQVTESKKKLNLLRKRKTMEKDEFDIDVEEEMFEDRDKKFRGGKGGKKTDKKISKKREAKNEKYGHGGKKRGIKRNDRESADQDDFNAGKNKSQFRGLKGSGSRGKKAQRPGKQRRQNMRSRTASRK
jgi:rRNA-processing protein EBP2